MTPEKSNSLAIKGKVLWSGSCRYMSLDEEILVKNYGMSKEEAHQFMLELIEIVHEKDD